MVVIKIKALSNYTQDASYIWPEYATPSASGLDLRASEDMFIPSGRRAKIRTGLAFELPHGFEGQIRPRSGLADKYGVTVLNAPGTLDADFRGEVCVILINHGEDDYHVLAGARIAQLVFAKVLTVSDVAIEKSTELSETTRGGGGFGSTGI